MLKSQIKQPELAPCPFCGGQAILRECQNEYYELYWSIECNKMCISMIEGWSKNGLSRTGSALLIQRWNTRTQA